MGRTHLVIKRRSGEGFKIGDDIEVVVHDVVGGQVKIGIYAPDGIKIFRNEIRPKGGEPDGLK